MKQQELIKGLEFVSKYELAPRQTEIVLSLVSGNKNVNDIKKNVPKTSMMSLRAIILKLKLKGVILEIGSNKIGLKTYSLNKDYL